MLAVLPFWEVSLLVVKMIHMKGWYWRSRGGGRGLWRQHTRKRVAWS